jgi:predicted dehydrogenase
MTNSLLCIIIIGAGRMGIRHALGALDATNVEKIILVDNSLEALETAKKMLKDHKKIASLTFSLLSEIVNFESDVVIVSTTASSRIDSCKLAINLKPKFVLIEKPLGQSLKQVYELESLFHFFPGKVYVNLNTRIYPFVKSLKSDLNNFPQFKGPINISFTGGSLGIGANGIHYLDLLYFLFDADEAKIVYSAIEPETLSSGRGIEFKDFGGLIVLEFFNKSASYLGRGILSLSSTSSVFGGWDIVGSHGRIRINELESSRVDILRDEKSEMPVNRYAVDYLSAKSIEIESPLLNLVTTSWLEGISSGISELPLLSESLKVHNLLFSWLSKCQTHKDIFPIT